MTQAQTFVDHDKSILRTSRHSALHARPFWSDRKICLGLFLGVLVVYLAVMRGRIEVYDTDVMLDVTQNLVNHGSLHAAGAGYPTATVWSPYGIGVSLLAIPPYALSLVTGHFDVLVSLVNPLVTATCVLLIYRIARALGWTPPQGVVASLAFGLPTIAVWYSLELLSEPEVTLCVLVIVLEMIRWRQGKTSAPLILGLALAAAVQFRSDSLLTVGVGLLALPLFVSRRELFSKHALVRVVPPILVSVAFLLWYNEIRFGSLLVFGYGPNDKYDTPILHGLTSLLTSPGVGLFVYNPLTIVGVVGVALILFGPRTERDRALGLLVVLLIVPRTLFFAKWHFWWGGDTWGPRFLLPVVALLSLMIVPVIRCSTNVITRTATYVALAVLGGFGAFVSYLSARVPLGEWLAVIGTPSLRAHLGIRNANTVSQQFEALYFKWSTSPIGGYVTLIRRHMALPSGDLWAYGHGGFGYAILGIGFLCLLVTCVGAVRVPRVSGVGKFDGTGTSPDPSRVGGPAERAAVEQVTTGAQ
jgi:hypothetical protein